MTAALLLALILCWSPSPDADLGYSVLFARIELMGWQPCAYDSRVMCPIYRRTGWRDQRVSDLRWFHMDCPGPTGSVCLYKHPASVNGANMLSERPMLLWAPPVLGDCQ